MGLHDYTCRGGGRTGDKTRSDAGLLLSRRSFIRLAAVAALLPALLRGAAEALGLAKRYRLGELGGLDLHATREVRGVCLYCSVGCGIIFYVRDGRVVYLEGDPDNPLNMGRLCAKGKASIALFGDHNPLRLRKPLIRVSPKPPYEEIIKTKDSDKLYEIAMKYKPVWREVSWDDALSYIARKWKEILEEAGVKPYHPYDGKVCDSRRGCYFYEGDKYPVMLMAGAKLTNEEGYMARKLSMLLGSNNIDHDARRCHSSTVAGLAATVGFGAQTQHFADLGYISVYLILGGNPGEAHPVSMHRVVEAQERGTLTLVVVDPKLGRTAAKADLFAFHRPGTDIAVIYYILHYAFHERSPPIDELPEFREYIERLNIDLEELEEFKDIVKKYTAEEVSRITGIPVEKLKRIARLYVENSGVTTGFKRFASIEWAMGLTQHTVGTQNCRAAAIMQLALGNLGFPGGGLNPYRGHSNVQGTTDMCVLCHVFPGYIKIPTNSKQVRAYQEWKLKGFPDAFNWRPSINTCRALGLKCSECGPDGDNCRLEVNAAALLWSWWFMNWRRFELSMGIFVGTDPEDEPWSPDAVVISDLPFHKGYTEVTWTKGALIDGVIRGVVLFAENIAVSDPDARETWAALAKAKLTVVTDVFETETAWFADVLLPGAIQYEKEGSITNSNRWVQWQHRVVPPPGEARPDLWIMVKLWEKLREAGAAVLPSEAAGKRVERVVVRHPYTGEAVELYRRRIEPFMDYSNPARKWSDYREVDAELVYREIDAAVDLYNGWYDWVRMYPLAKRMNPAPRKPGMVDGLIDSGLLIHPASKTPLRMYKDWGWSWPKNVRVLYDLWTLSKTFGKTVTWRFGRGVYAVGPELDGKTVTITGETGEIIDAKTGELRPAFIPGHNFYIGKFYKRAWTCLNDRCAEKTVADIFTGAYTARELIKEARVVGRIVRFTETGYEVLDASSLGIKYPIQESFYYDPEVVMKGKALFNKPYFKGSKTVDGKTIVYKPWSEWRRVHSRFLSELRACVGGNGLRYRDCVKSMIEKYGEWYATMGPDGKVWAYGLNYPLHFEPTESPSLELQLDYPPFTYRHPYNRIYLFPPQSMPELAWEIAVSLAELEKRMPAGAVPAVATTNRLEEHWHTGALSRNNPYLAELVPEPFVEIPVELAEKLGVRSGDIVEVGNVRNRIYLRAYVTRRMPRLRISGRTVYVVNIPWHWGFAGMNNSPAEANLLTPSVGDTTTTIQESKVFLVWVRKAPPTRYVFHREPPSRIASLQFKR